MIALLVLLLAGPTGPPPDRMVAWRAFPSDTILQLPEVRVERERELSEARRRLPTAFVTDLQPRRDARAVESLADVLAEAAGVHVDQYGGLGAFSTVSVRGAPSGQVAVYLDGVPLTSAAHGVVSLADLPVTAVDRVEVYRGLSPLALGIATPGGAINVVTLSNPGAREIKGARGAFGTWEAHGTAGAARGRVSGLVHAGYQGSAGDFRYLDDNGTPFNAADDSVHARANGRFDAATMLASLTWVPRRGWAVLAREDLFRKTQGLPGMGTVPTRTASLDLLRSLSHVQVTAEGARWRPRARLLAALDVERTRDRDPAGELGYGRHDTDDVLAGRSLSLELEWPRLVPRATVLASGGLRGEWQTQRDRADGAPDPPQSRRLARGAALGLQLRPLGDWLTLHGATRWDHLEDRLHSVGVAGAPTGTSAARELDSPQAGVRVAAPWGIELRGNWARAARAPGFEELFGREGSILGNPALAPERGENWDAGFGWSRAWSGGRRAGFEWAHFESRTRDLVFYERVFQNVRPRNLQRAFVRGEELSLQCSGPLGLSGAAAFTWQSAVNQAPFAFWNGRQLPLRPARQAWARLDWHGRGLHAGAEIQYLGDDWLDPSNRSRVASRTLVGASLSAPLATPALRATLQGRNLGDNRVADIAGYPLPGRGVFVSLDLRGGATAADR